MRLVTLDLEATGLDTNTARIVEVGTTTARWLVNPGIRIPKESSDITGITDETVAGMPTFAEIAGEVAAALDCDLLVGFNITRYDVPLLAAEFERAGMPITFPPLLDVAVLDKIARPRTLTAAVEHWLSRKHEGAHGAVADCLATSDVLEAMRLWYPAWKETPLEDLARISRWGRDAADPAGKFNRIDGVLCYAFGMHIGKPVRDEQSYAGWMLRSDFPEGTKRMLREAIK